jgi:hypothetical protein
LWVSNHSSMSVSLDKTIIGSIALTRADRSLSTLTGRDGV